MPGKITDDRYDLVLEALKQGFTQYEAIKIAGIGKSAYFEKKRDDPDFSDKIKKAFLHGKLELLQKLDKAREWQAAAWKLERLHGMVKKSEVGITERQAESRLPSWIKGESDIDGDTQEDLD